MREITTVTGMIKPKDLGFCQCHEHLLIRKGHSFLINPILYMDDSEKTVEEIHRFQAAGGHTIIDAQPVGCGRMAEELQEIAERTKLNVIASTGFHKLCFYNSEHWIHTATKEELQAIFIHELTEGMYTDGDTSYPEHHCNAKAGIIKTAFDSCELTARYRILFEAAIYAAIETDSRISVHIETGSNPIKLLSYLTDKNFPLKRLMLCHMDRAIPNMAIHKRIASMGAYLEYDTIGRFKYHSDVYEIQLMKEMIESGYGTQLLFSLDTTRERLKSYHSQGIGLDYILTTFLPLMKSAGITTSQLQRIYHDNCVHMLTDSL